LTIDDLKSDVPTVDFNRQSSIVNRQSKDVAEREADGSARIRYPERLPGRIFNEGLKPERIPREDQPYRLAYQGQLKPQFPAG